MLKQTDMKIPRTNWLAIGIALGSGLGVLFDSVGIGIAVGTVFGALVDEQSRKH